VIGVIIAAGGVFYAIKTLKAGVESLALAARAQRENTIIAHAQFLVAVRGIFINYDDVHASLRPQGIWAPKENEKYALKGPENAAEWARVEVYMGTFEYCEKLIGHGLLDQEDFAALYRYRIQNLLRNGVIVREKLHNHQPYWTDFCRLCERLRVDIPSPEELARSAYA
jgi:hypothetical protein